MNEYKNKTSPGTKHWNKKCIDLTWHQNQDIVFKKNLLKVKETHITFGTLELTSKKNNLLMKMIIQKNKIK